MNERIKSIFIEDLESIIPMTIEILQSRDEAGQEFNEGINLWTTLEAAMSDSQRVRSAGIIAEEIDYAELSPLTRTRLDAAVKAKAELARRHRETDNELAEMCRSILMAGMRWRS